MAISCSERKFKLSTLVSSHKINLVRTQEHNFEATYANHFPRFVDFDYAFMLFHG